MSMQESCFNTAHVMDNEIVKASDFEFAFENLVTNVSKVAQMMLESNQDFVINGKVLPYSGMNVQVSPIFGVCKSTGIPFGRTETAVMEYGFEESENGRIDIIEVKGDWETYDNQQRAFNDPDTDVKTYQYVDTKKLMRPVYRIKKGAEGSSVAPEVDEGFVKLAEVVIRANNSTIAATDIKNITSDIAGVNNTDWTTEPAITYNIGYISDVNERFRVQHNSDGTHKDNVINSDSLDIGVNAKQINGNVLPIGGNVSIPTQSTTTTESIQSVVVKVAAVVTSLYNAYLKYGTYGFKGTLAISDIANSSDILTKPLTLSADGSGQAFLKIGTTTVLTINENGRLTTNGYTASNDNDIVTKKVTDAIVTSVSALADRVTALESLYDNTEYINGTLSADRYSYSTIDIKAATTANIQLSGAQTIDGVTLTNGQNVLVKNQTNKKDNGIYSYSSNSAWSRTTDANTPAKMKAKIFEITNGTANAGKLFYLPKVNFNDSSSFGSDDIEILEYFGSKKKIGNKVVVRESNGKINADVNGTATKLETARNLGVALGSTTAKTFDGTGNVTDIPVSGTLGVTNGGTGKNNARDACNTFINALDTGSSTPVDADYYVSQSVSGGTTTTTYHRRPMSALWEYIKGKISSVLGLTSSQYGGNAATATSATSATSASSATNASNLGTYTEAKLNNILIGSATPTNYATKTAYAVGAYVWYSNKLWRCKTAVPATSTAWDSSKWVEVVPLPISVNSATNANYAASAGTATSATSAASANKLAAGDNSINDVSINWRNNAEYYTTTSYQTAGNEALVFATKNNVTSFMFVNGEDSVTNHANNRWQDLTPGLQIKNNKVAIGKLIPNGTTPTVALDVNGTVKATHFSGNITGDVTGSVTGNVTGNCTGSSGSCTGNSKTATKLETSRNLGVALGSTTARTFNGNADVTDIPVSGTLGVTNGGTGQTSLANVTVGKASNSDQLESKTWRQTALQGVWIDVNTTSLDNYGAYTFEPSTPAPGSTAIVAGSVVRVCFRYALQSSVKIEWVKFSYGGQIGKIVAARNNTTVALQSHVFTGGNYSSTYKNKVWDAYTTLELMWTGSEWLVMGNPDVCKYFSTSQSYTVKANGLITQYAKKPNTGTQSSTTWLVQFSSDSSYIAMPLCNYTGYSDKGRGFVYNPQSKTYDSFIYQYRFTNSGGSSDNRYDDNMFVLGIGY